MAESSRLEDMGAEKISVSGQTNTLQLPNLKSESFIVDISNLSGLTDKEICANSRIALQRSLSRKGSQSEKQMNSSIANKRDPPSTASGSPREAALSGASMPEKPMVVMVGAADQASNSLVHHQITIMTSNIGGTTTTTAATTESRWSAKRFSLRRPPSLWAFDPRRILLLFATLSSLGSMLLIYFTLCMGKHGGDESALNW